MRRPSGETRNFPDILHPKAGEDVHNSCVFENFAHGAQSNRSLINYLKQSQSDEKLIHNTHRQHTTEVLTGHMYGLWCGRQAHSESLTKSTLPLVSYEKSTLMYLRKGWWDSVLCRHAREPDRTIVRTEKGKRHRQDCTNVCFRRTGSRHHATFPQCCIRTTRPIRPNGSDDSYSAFTEVGKNHLFANKSKLL